MPAPGSRAEAQPTVAAPCSPTLFLHAASLTITSLRSAALAATSRRWRMELFQSADVVLAVGTSLSYYVGGGHYFAKACTIQVDDAPRGLRDGQKAADIYVKSDALVGVEAILVGLDKVLGSGQTDPRWDPHEGAGTSHRDRARRFDAVRD